MTLSKVDALAISQGSYYDADAAATACDFIGSFCRISKGGAAGEPMVLIPWQRDLVSRLFGWMRADGTRRFRTCYVEIPKKNGKSKVMSAIAIYAGIADGETGAEVYICASTVRQARIIFDDCAAMVRSSPALRKRLKIRDTAKQISHLASGSKIEALTKDAESQDGFDASVVIFDELHRQKDTRLWDVMRYAGSARRQPLLITITTAGSARDSLCWREHERARRVIEGELLDTEHLAIIYAAGEDDALDDPATWRKSNPSLGITLKEDDFRRDLADAKDSPIALPNFLRLRLNRWVANESRYFRRDRWDACGREPIDMEALRGKACWAGQDLSSTEDFTSVALWFPGDDGSFTIVPYFWLPSDMSDRSPRDADLYKLWARQGFLKLTEGERVDYDVIRSDINAFMQDFDIRKMLTDPHNCNQICTQLIGDGLSIETFRQGYISMNEPTKEFERLVTLGQVRHGNHPVLTWMADNAIVTHDEAGNVKLNKLKSREKIDGLYATVQAVAAWMSDQEAPSPYQDRGILML